MSTGRPPMREKLVERMDGSERAKKRLKAILETLSGTRTVGSACEELGINSAMFYKLRNRFLQESVEGLEERKRGVKPKRPPEVKEELEKMNQEIESLTVELHRSRIREEIALALVRPVVDGAKKGSGPGR